MLRTTPPSVHRHEDGVFMALARMALPAYIRLLAAERDENARLQARIQELEAALNRWDIPGLD